MSSLRSTLGVRGQYGRLAAKSSVQKASKLAVVLVVVADAWLRSFFSRLILVIWPISVFPLMYYVPSEQIPPHCKLEWA